MTNNALQYWLLFVWYKSVILGSFLGLMMCFICYYKCKISNTNRWFWFEIHDQDWCPTVFKQYLRRILYEVVYKNGLHHGDALSKLILPLIQRYNISLILDLCSGSCGPSTIINQNINNAAPTKPIITILTDLYPQISSWKVFASTNKNILYSSKPIDATNIDQNQIKHVLSKGNKNVDDTLITARTIFAAFHHFESDLCVKIFEDGFRNNNIILIADGYAARSLIDFISLAIIFIVLLPYGTFKCIQFWLFDDVESHLMKRILYSVSVVIFYGLCTFWIVHDGVVSLARFWDESALLRMSETALNNINETKQNNKVKYECKCIQVQTKDATSIKVVQNITITKYAASIFMCVPISKAIA